MKKFLPNRFELTTGVIFGLIPLIIAAPIIFLKFGKIKTVITSPKKFFSNYVESPTEVDTTVDILLMGHGGRGHSGGSLADAFILAHLNHQTKEVALISIPRDTWVELPTRSDIKQSHKINMSYAIGSDDASYPLKEPVYVGYHGGGNMAKHATNIVTGVFPDYYVAIDFDSFTSAIDTLGGLNVEVPVSFADEYYPISGLENEACGKSNEEITRLHQEKSGFELESEFKCRYETLTFQAGLTKMDGATALKFVRSRHSTTYGSDFARGERQQALVLALIKELISAKALKNVEDLYEQYKNFVRTDISLEDAVATAEYIKKPENYTIKKLNLTDKNYLQFSTTNDGQSVLIPKLGNGNFEEIHSFITAELER
jgi:anionic cell wall polymer biosynthesis LytR-Cps2A-Psr (LCP) family protein